jgi:hypothetical protein
MAQYFFDSGPAVFFRWNEEGMELPDSDGFEGLVSKHRDRALPRRPAEALG